MVSHDVSKGVASEKKPPPPPMMNREERGSYSTWES